MSTNGNSRPVTIVLSYLMYVNKMSLADANAFVKLKRKSALPNANFMA
jgi:protein-tyrosine phosphatase